MRRQSDDVVRGKRGQLAILAAWLLSNDREPHDRYGLKASSLKPRSYSSRDMGITDFTTVRFFFFARGSAEAEDRA